MSSKASEVTAELVSDTFSLPLYDDPGDGGDGGRLDLTAGFANGRSKVDHGGAATLRGGDCETPKRPRPHFDSSCRD